MNEFFLNLLKFILQVERLLSYGCLLHFLPQHMLSNETNDRLVALFVVDWLEL